MSIADDRVFLMHVDGVSFLKCYLWTSMRALWTEDYRQAWWGSNRDALKIQREWGTSPIVRPVCQAKWLERLEVKLVDARTATQRAILEWQRTPSGFKTEVAWEKLRSEHVRCVAELDRLNNYQRQIS